MDTAERTCRIAVTCSTRCSQTSTLDGERQPDTGANAPR